MQKLKDLMLEIIQTKEIADKKPSVDDPNVRRAMLGKIKRAKENLEDLTDQYRNLVKFNCAFILTCGSQRDKFAKLSREEFSCFPSDSFDFYNELIENINSRMYVETTGSPSLFNLIGSNLEVIAKKMGVIGYPPLLFEQKFKKRLKDKQDLLNVTIQAINDKIGAEMVGHYCIKKSTDMAVKSQFTGNIVPIVITIKDSELTKEFVRTFKTITKNVFVVTTGSKPNKELKTNSISHLQSVNKDGVEKTLTKIRENLNL